MLRNVTGLTGTLDIAEPGLKVATMTNRQRRNFNQGVQAVNSNSEVIASCLDENLSGPEGIVDRPPERPMLCIISSSFAEHLTYVNGCIVVVIDDGMPTSHDCSNVRKQVENEHPSLVFSKLQLEDRIDYNLMSEYFSVLEDATTVCDVLHIDTQFNDRWCSRFEIPTIHCQGNLSFATNSVELQALMNEWSEAGYYAPRTLEDAKDESFLDVLSSTLCG